MDNLINECDSMLDVLNYTVSAMTETGYSEREINNYLNEATSKDNMYLLEKSIFVVEECNRINSYNSDWLSYKGFDDYGFFSDISEDDYLLSDDINYNLNDFDDEAYEGYGSCHKHYYNCN